MADISQEINDFKNAIYGEEVRGSMISLAEKLNTEVESNTTNVNQAVETANTASTAANQAVDDANTTLQAANQAVTTAAGSAEDAEESATAAANSATAAAGSAEDAEESATAAANSATAAAQSAADAAEAAEGLEGFNGQASSVKAEDTEGLVGTAGGQTNVQALIDYIADQVKNQLVSDSALTTKLAKYILKSQIINNLLATQAGNVLDAVQGKALSDMIGDTSQLPEGAGNVVGAVAQLNRDYQNIVQIDDGIAQIGKVILVSKDISVTSAPKQWVAIPGILFPKPLIYTGLFGIHAASGKQYIFCIIPTGELACTTDTTVTGGISLSGAYICR